MRTVVRVSPWKTGMKHPLTYMWIRFGNDLGWASLQHLLAYERVRMGFNT